MLNCTPFVRQYGILLGNGVLFYAKGSTEFSLFVEKLYLSPILDLHSSDLVSYTISDRPVLSMVTNMLNEAFAKIPDGTNLILHFSLGCPKVSCCICRSSAPWSTSSTNSLNIWITTTTAGSRQN